LASRKQVDQTIDILSGDIKVRSRSNPASARRSHDVVFAQHANDRFRVGPGLPEANDSGRAPGSAQTHHFVSFGLNTSRDPIAETLNNRSDFFRTNLKYEIKRSF